MENRELTIKNIPYGYPLCFNDECANKEKCMHYQARLLKLDGRLQGSAEARRRVRNYFSSGCGPYYRYHHGENKLSPREQADILAILAKYGPTDGLTFDHYETDWNFD